MKKKKLSTVELLANKEGARQRSDDRSTFVITLVEDGGSMVRVETLVMVVEVVLRWSKR